MGENMLDLQLTPSEVNAVLAEIENAITASDGIMEELGTVMTNLGTCWEGQAYNSYLAAYNKYKETVLTQFNLLMQTYKKTYNDAAVTLQYDDDVVSQNVNAMLGY